MIIKIDYREKDLYTLLVSQNKEGEKDSHKIISENLPLGDIIVCDDTGQEKAIIERKTLKDLAASIRDGRYAEQSFRLQQCSLPNHNIFYLIEGDLRQYRPFPLTGGVSKKALISAMTSITYFKGFSLQRCITLDESAEWLNQFTSKIHKSESEGLTAYYKPLSVSAIDTDSDADAPTDGDIADQIPYSSVVANKRVKRDNITPLNIGEIMLMQIPGVSQAVAAVIMSEYTSIQHLIETISKDPLALNALTIANKTGKTRKVAKPAIQNIYAYLLNSAV